MRILTASDRALLVEAADLDEAMRLNAAWADIPGVIEQIPGARTVLVRFDPGRVPAERLAEMLENTPAGAVDGASGPEVTVPVRYDGEDLDEVARLLGVSTDEVIARHLAAHWRVAFSGFAPGFGYVVGDDPLFDVPRRATPRTRVPAGAVGLAGAFTGVYPRSSPGGWQLIGQTDAVMWDVDRDPPALLAPGTRVRFVRAAADSVRGPFDKLRDPNKLRDPDVGGLAVEVVRPSLQLLVQDLGRPGHAALGVSASGAVDRTALRDANRAVGNAAGAAALESVGGVTLRFHGDGVAAVTGAVAECTMTDAAGEDRPIAHGIPFATYDGDLLTIGTPTRGLRCVIAVRGGIRVPPVLGSMSADTLGGLGPAPLTAGDVVPIGSDAIDAVHPYPWPRELPSPGELVELDITLGPRDDWFTAAALRMLGEQEWLVTQRADRVGIRLLGDVPLERALSGELPSEGAVTGAIQVPPDGQPVLFLADHPVTGGYPIVGSVTDACLDLAGQLPPGARVRFRIVESGASDRR